MPAMTSLDNSQGKWFAQGGAARPGYVIATHAECRADSKETGNMTLKACERFLLTGSTVKTALPKAMVLWDATVQRIKW